MKREFIYTTVFDRRWEEMGLADTDLQALEKFIMDNPEAGDIIRGTGGAIKLRFALPSENKGKRGGVRVIYMDIVRNAHTHLLLCYAKSKQDDLTNEQTKQLKSLVKTLKGES